MPGRVLALLILAWALVRALVARVTGRRTGLLLFQQNYEADRLPALSVADREGMETFGGCIACGLCNEGEGARMAASKGAYPGLMQVVLASSRSMPDFDAACRALEHVPEKTLLEKEGICPVNIPFRRLAAFVREKASATLELQSWTAQWQSVGTPSEEVDVASGQGRPSVRPIIY